MVVCTGPRTDEQEHLRQRLEKECEERDRLQVIEKKSKDIDIKISASAIRTDKNFENAALQIDSSKTIQHLESICDYVYFLSPRQSCEA